MSASPHRVPVTVVCQLTPATSLLVPVLSANGNDRMDQPGRFPQLTEPPCSYCSTQNRKGFILPTDRVIAWVRGDHNGGAFPLRFFLARTRIVNDTYGLFFHDPDGGFITAFALDAPLDDRMLTFSADEVSPETAPFKDRETGSRRTLAGRAVDGPLGGKELTWQPSIQCRWYAWTAEYPETILHKAQP